MPMNFEWTVSRISEMQKVWAKETAKVDFAVEKQNGEYAEWFVFTLFGNKADVLNVAKIKVWDEVDVSFNHKVASYEKDWVVRKFNNINAWKVVKITSKWLDDNWDDCWLPF